jgi:hypothetical protein
VSTPDQRAWTGDRVASELALSYLLAPESTDYCLIMDVLCDEVNEQDARNVARALHSVGHTQLGIATVERRLASLKSWGAVHGEAELSGARTVRELESRQEQYRPSGNGRAVHRFWREHLAGETTLREISLATLRRAVQALQELADGPDLSPAEVATLSAQVFDSHAQIDGQLSGHADALAGVAERFDLDDVATSGLRTMIVDYARTTSAELDRGSEQAHHALQRLLPRVGELVEAALADSSVRELVQRGTLLAARGSQEKDWYELAAWFDPVSGRSGRFAARLVRAIPSLQVNLQRLHTSAGTATARSRLLSLARAATDVTTGPQVYLAALGDHPWRALSGVIDDTEGVPPWGSGGTTASPTARANGVRAATMGRFAAPADDTAARAQVVARRAERAAAHADAVAELLVARPGQVVSLAAGRVGLAALLRAAATPAREGVRTASMDGVAATVVHIGRDAPGLVCERFAVHTPLRQVFFHPPGVTPAGLPVALLDPDRRASVIGGTA